MRILDREESPKFGPTGGQTKRGENKIHRFYVVEVGPIYFNVFLYIR